MKASLLIIGDDLIHHQKVEELLYLNAYPIYYQCFSDASDAFNYILNHNDFEALPDLVLLDLDMPFVSWKGFLELFETITQSLEKRVDVIVYTSSVDADIKSQMAHYNCVKGVVHKPLTQDIFDEILSSSFVLVNKASKY
ncbi:MAG TPA: response regulator [Pedobacter sp.]|jgi:CheY-like chemotaxis protein